MRSANAKLQAIWFDLDGTLVDSAPDLAVPIHDMRKDRGLSPLSDEVLRPYTSMGARGLILRGFGVKKGDESFDGLRDEFLSRYEAAMVVHTRLFPGMERVLEHIESNGLMWGVVSNKFERYVRYIIDALNLTSRCAAIIGGDTTESDRLEVHVFAAGTVPHGKARLRSGARPGDCLFVTGLLGGSRHGRHLSFEPRVREGQWLRDWATAMIDLSDGLATDLRHLATASGTGAELDAAAIPVAPAAGAGIDAALAHALGDGEDFELLFTVTADHAPLVASRWAEAWPDLRLSRIGRIVPGTSISILTADGRRHEMLNAGCQHFAPGSGIP